MRVKKLFSRSILHIELAICINMPPSTSFEDGPHCVLPSILWLIKNESILAMQIFLIRYIMNYKICRGMYVY